MQEVAVSVHAAQRSKSPLEVQAKCEELIRHTVHICSNERVFDPRYSSFTARIVDTAVMSGKLLWQANGIRVNDNPRKWDRRRDLQESACEELDSLLYLIGVARRLYHLRKGKYEHWARLASETRDLARRWRDSDARRYGRLQSGTPS